MTVHEAPWGETREWYTPPELFDALGLRFDLDPASPMSGPVPWVPAEKFYSPRENGLMQPWEGRVWLNPPYGPPGVSFVDRLIHHGNGMLLIPARTETRVFQRAADAADAVCFLRDRLHFTRADGFKGRAAFASVLMAFGMQNKYALLAAGPRLDSDDPCTSQGRRMTKSLCVSLYFGISCVKSQNQQTQTPLRATSCGFDPRLRHHFNRCTALLSRAQIA